MHDFSLSYKEPSVFVGEHFSPVKPKKASRPSSNIQKKAAPVIFYPDSDNDSDIFSRNCKRGPYRRYTQATKEEAVGLALKLGDVNKASYVYDIPVKNLRRWVRLGTEKKKGGRKTRDPVMETKLKTWILRFKEDYGMMPLKADIKNKALELTEFKDIFKASKGWFEKFMVRQFPELVDRNKKRFKTRNFVELERRFADEGAGLMGKRRSARLRSLAEKAKNGAKVEKKPEKRVERKVAKKGKVAKENVEVAANESN